MSGSQRSKGPTADETTRLLDQAYSGGAINTDGGGGGTAEHNVDDEGFADLGSSVFNLTNTIVGGGVLALPYAFAACGVLLGMFFLLFVAALSLFSLVLLIETTQFASQKHKSTYRELARLSLGTAGVITTDVALILACFGAMCSYLVIICDMLVPLIANWTGVCEELVDRTIVVLSSFAIVFPVSCLRYLNMFRFTSLVAVVAMLYLVVTVVVKSGMGISEGLVWQCRQEDGCFNVVEISVDFFRTIPIISFAFTCQMNFFTIFAELFKPTTNRMFTVCLIAMGICTTLYMLMGVFGYLTFFDDVQGNILLNYDPDDIFINIGRFGVAFVIIFSYPLMAHPCINTVDDLLFGKRDFSWVRRISITLVLCSGSLLIALFVHDVSFIFGITGATAGSMIAFILPSLFYLRLAPPSEDGVSCIKVGSWVMLILGIVFMVASTTITIYDEIQFGNEASFNSSYCPPVGDGSSGSNFAF